MDFVFVYFGTQFRILCEFIITSDASFCVTTFLAVRHTGEIRKWCTLSWSSLHLCTYKHATVEHAGLVTTAAEAQHGEGNSLVDIMGYILSEHNYDGDFFYSWTVYCNMNVVQFGLKPVVTALLSYWMPPKTSAGILGNLPPLPLSAASVAGFRSSVLVLEV